MEWFPTTYEMRTLHLQPDTVLTEDLLAALRRGKRGAVCAGRWAARQGGAPAEVLTRTLRNARRWELRHRGLTPLQGYLLRGAYETAMWDAWRAAWRAAHPPSKKAPTRRTSGKKPAKPGGAGPTQKRT